MKKYIIPIVMLLAVGATSCDDALDLEPQDRITDKDYFNTENDLMLFSNPFYNNILPKKAYDSQSDLIVAQDLSNELRGGSFRPIPKTSGGGGWKWTDLRRINTLLENVDKCDNPSAVVKYTAITRFFRAYFYFDKVVRFGDVPWYDTQIGSTNKDLLYKARDSRELVMTKMLEDVNYAIENLPDHKAQTNVPYRVTKWAALALKSQFCLFEGTFRKYHGLQIEGHDAEYYLKQSAEAAAELIENGPYKIWSSGKPASDYRDLFIAENANADEYILAIKYDNKIPMCHDAYGFSFTTARGMPGYTRKFINMYLMKDGTKFTDRAGWQEMTYADEIKNRDPRLSQSIRTPGFTLNKKVHNPNLSESVTGYNPIKFVPDGVTRNDYCSNDLPVFRIAEVMLNYAEARAELGELTQDDLDKTVNKIRDRVSMPHLDMAEANANPDYYLSSTEYGYPKVGGANSGVILEIRRDRGVELSQEGDRWADIRRWKAGKCYDQPITGMYFPGAGSYDLDGDGKPEIVLYRADQAKPDVAGAQVYMIGSEVKLTQGDKGYVNYHGTVERTPFNEDRDYYYPISSYDIDLYKAAGYPLVQNPGWF